MTHIALIAAAFFVGFFVAGLLSAGRRQEEGRAAAYLATAVERFTAACRRRAGFPLEAAKTGIATGDMPLSMTHHELEELETALTIHREQNAG